MNKLEVGMYVRIKKYGLIGDIYNINEFREPSKMYAIDVEGANDLIFVGKDDIEASYSLKKLLKIGDYVNGLKIDFIEFGTGSKLVIHTYDEKKEIGFKTELREEDIETIVTKEQFEAMAYKVGGNNE